MVVASGDLAFHWPFAALSGVVASRAPRRVRRTLVDGACDAARSGNRSRRFLLCGQHRQAAELLMTKVGGRASRAHNAKHDACSRCRQAPHYFSIILNVTAE